jgi:YVTN family beta-propeller protein
MKFHYSIAAFAVACLIGSAPGQAQKAYITNAGNSTVSVVDTATNTVTDTISSSNLDEP